ncbi:ABC transporter ATP-binding protein [Thermopirellula anaerolimosa]
MNAVIRTEELAKRFGRVKALDGVSLEIPPGVVWALLGRNGAGKSTLIRILMGLLEPDRGRAAVLGHDCRTEYLTIRRKVGYVPELPVLYDWMTVAEIGRFCAAFHPAGYVSEYLRVAAQFGLRPDQELRHLSKGMRAGVVLSLALGHDPDLLILDEPTSGLDVMFRRQFLESMVDRAAAGKTVFLASHQVHEVERVADIVAFLKEGRVILVEPLERLKREMRRLILTFADDSTAEHSRHALAAEDGVLRIDRDGRQLELVVRSPEESPEGRFQAASGVQRIAAHACSLEEIFTAYMGPEIQREASSPEEART